MAAEGVWGLGGGLRGGFCRRVWDLEMKEGGERVVYILQMGGRIMFLLFFIYFRIF